MDDHIMFMLKQLQCTCYCDSFNKFLFIKICHLVSHFIFSGQLKTVWTRIRVNMVIFMLPLWQHHAIVW